MRTKRHKTYPTEKQKALEAKLRALILEAKKCEREQRYREVYETIHKFFLSYKRVGSGRIYSIPKWKKLLFYLGICRMAKNKNVLEIGCGEGWLCMFLSRFCTSVTGVDVSDIAIRLSEEKRRFVEKREKLRFLRLDATKLNLLSETFDLVISINLLEHLHPEDLVLHLKEVFGIMNNEGKYFFSTPNRYVEGEAKGLHLKMYTHKELAQILEEHGFQVKTNLVSWAILPRVILVPIKIKVSLEAIFNKFRVPKFFWVLPNLNQINAVAVKTRINR